LEDFEQANDAPSIDVGQDEIRVTGVGHVVQRLAAHNGRWMHPRDTHPRFYRTERLKRGLLAAALNPQRDLTVSAVPHSPNRTSRHD
jgi:hypothetical protein